VTKVIDWNIDEIDKKLLSITIITNINSAMDDPQQAKLSQ